MIIILSDTTPLTDIQSTIVQVKDNVHYVQTNEPVFPPNAWFRVYEDKLPIDLDIQLITPYNSMPRKARPLHLQVRIYKRCVGVEKGA